MRTPKSESDGLTAKLSRERLNDVSLWLGLQRELGLSDRQLQVAVRLVLGDSLSQIGARLGIGKWTVKGHVDRIKRKAGVATRSQLVVALLMHSGLLLGEAG